MDKEKIISYLSTGSIPAGTDTKVPLKDIVHTFPYFQLAQVLYAKQMYDDNDTEVASRVKLASAYAPNRKAMYLLFRKQNQKVEVKEVKPVVAEPVVVQEEKKYNFVYQSTEPPVIKEVPKVESFVVSLPTETEPVKEEKVVEKTKASPVSETFLETEILSNIAIIQSEQTLNEMPALENEVK